MTVTTPGARPDDTRLDWFTHAILPNGQQTCAIRPELPTEERTVLDEAQSRLLQAVLTELARDEAVPFNNARQAVLRAFVRATPGVRSAP